MTSTASTERTVRLLTKSTTWIEEEAIRQLYAAARLPGIRQAIGFPDLHPGRGGPVGAAFVTDDQIYPHLIGSDIGCGFSLFKTNLLKRQADLDRWAAVRFDLEHPWEGTVRSRLQNAGLCATQFGDDFGTLGAGNHFAELQTVERIHDSSAFAALGLNRENLVALVHSGSRGFGTSVFESYVEEHGSAGVTAHSESGAKYLLLHDHAVRWAQASRNLLADRFVAPIGGQCELVLNSCHNGIQSRTTSAGESVWIHRKGTAPSDGGAVIIPGTRGSFSYLVQPLGTQDATAWSLAHGAGRKWSRSESRQRMRERFRARNLSQTPLGSRVICEERSLLYEEAPEAYKQIEDVIDDLRHAGLASIVATLRPLLTYKVRKLRR